MKITPRPVTIEDENDKSRDIGGVNKWARSSRTIGFIMFILGWFTIPIEVLLRRDFGQRWFTMVNFYAGAFLLLLFAGLQYFVTVIWEFVVGFIESILENFFSYDAHYYKPLFADLMDKSMMYILLAYMVLGSYHLFKIWWRNRANIALHSFDDGTSRLEPLGGLLMQVINAIAVPFVALYVSLLPKGQRGSIDIPQLIQDRTAFTNTAVEPFLLFALAIKLNGVLSLWLFISAIATTIHANWKETAKLNKILDFRDSVIEAKVMMQLRNGTVQTAVSPASNAPTFLMQQAAESIKDNPQVAPQMAGQYPDLMSIIEDMNQDRSHLSHSNANH